MPEFYPSFSGSFVFPLYYIAVYFFVLSIRALFGESMLANAVHGSSTAEKAQKVIQTFIGEVPEEEEEGGEGGEGAIENGAGVSYISPTNLLITVSVSVGGEET